MEDMKLLLCLVQSEALHGVLVLQKCKEKEHHTCRQKMQVPVIREQPFSAIAERSCHLDLAVFKVVFSPDEQ